jgi:hypothetical protein
MNSQQYKRYHKIFEDELYLIDFNDKLEFNISGSTKNIYKVVIIDGKFDCNCPDNKSWAKKYHVVCKHTCFVLFKVIKLFDNNFVSNIQNQTQFFTTLKLSDQELDKINIFIKNKNITSDIINQDLIDKFNKLKTESNVNIFAKSTKHIDMDDECPICYDILLMENDISKLLSCPECKNYVHNKCMEKWLEYNKTCVYCRSDIWKNNGKESKYINLS